MDSVTRAKLQLKHTEKGWKYGLGIAATANDDGGKFGKVAFIGDGKTCTDATSGKDKICKEPKAWQSENKWPGCPCNQKVAGAGKKQLKVSSVLPKVLLGALYRHRRRHVYCAGIGVSVLKMTASERRSF